MVSFQRAPTAQALLEDLTPKEGDLERVTQITTNDVWLRHYGHALALVRKQLETPQALAADLPYFEGLLGHLQQLAGDPASTDTYRKARAEFEAALRDKPDEVDLVSGLALVEAGLGNKASALAQARRAVALLPESKDYLRGPVYEETLARVQARFGDTDGAIAALQHLLSIPYDGPPITVPKLRVDPDWDRLRDDPRFQKLIAGGTVLDPK